MRYVTLDDDFIPCSNTTLKTTHVYIVTKYFVNDKSTCRFNFEYVLVIEYEQLTIQQLIQCLFNQRNIEGLSWS